MSEPRVIDEPTQAHIDRFKAGAEVWNNWAKKKLAQKRAFEATCQKWLASKQIKIVHP